MILYSDSKINFVNQENIIKLNIPNEDSYIYLSCDTFIQALLISDRFEGEISLIEKTLGTDDVQKEAVKFFYSNAPEPVNILAPFLGLLDEDDYELNKDLKQLSGVLHMMSLVINFNNYLKVPEDVRKDISYTNVGLFDYEESWNSLQESYKVSELDGYEVLSHIIKETVIAVMEEYTPAGDALVQSNSQEEYEDEDYDPWAAMNSIMEEELSKQQAEEEKEEKVNNTTVSSSVEEETKLNIQEDEEVITEDEEASIYDNIAKMFGGIKE